MWTQSKAAPSENIFLFSYFRLISTEVTGVALAISRVSAVYDFIEKYTENGGARMSNSLPFPKEGWSFVK